MRSVCLRLIRYDLSNFSDHTKYFATSESSVGVRLDSFWHQLRSATSFASLARRNRLEFVDSAFFLSIQMSGGFRISKMTPNCSCCGSIRASSPFRIPGHQLDYPVVGWPISWYFSSSTGNTSFIRIAKMTLQAGGCHFSHAMVYPI
jgi:hypothetical protein